MLANSDTHSPLSYESIREYAELVGRTHSIWDDDGHADIDRLLGRLGGVSRTCDSPYNLVVHGPQDFEVNVLSFTSKRRARFAKAFAVGQYFVHYRHSGAAGKRTFRRGQNGTATTQANVFAATLLLPEEAFRAAHNRYDGDPWRLSTHFDVSPLACSTRSSALGLTSLRPDE